MTQTTTTYKVQGKDRLSDPWTTFASTDRDEAIRWADARAFVMRDIHDEPLVLVSFRDESDR